MHLSYAKPAPPETTGTLDALEVYESVVKQDLSVLAATANDLHAGVQKAAGEVITKARRCGEFLIQIKGEVGHGNFIAWVEANTNIPARTARRYMMLARGWELLCKTATVADLPIVQATELIARAQRQAKYVPLTKELCDEINSRPLSPAQRRKQELSAYTGECISELHKTVEKLHEIGPTTYREVEANVLRSMADKVERWSLVEEQDRRANAPKDNEYPVISIKLNGKPHEYTSWRSAAYAVITVLTNPAAPKSNIKACKEFILDIARRLDVEGQR